MIDRDLASVQDARELLRRASVAQTSFARFDQAAVDRVVDAMARAATDHARELAELAVRETGIGRVESKIEKNLFCSRDLHRAYRNLRTCGVVRADRGDGVIEVASPVGIVAGIIPTTNPTSTAIFKILIAVKGRNGIVLSPHPRAVECIRRTAEVCRRAAVASGAPEDLVACMDRPTLEGTTELMRHELTSMIVATGGPGVVRAAYSSGKPAYGVGPGNAPVFVHASADLAHAARCLVDSQCFDYGTICSSEQSLVVERSVAAGLRAALTAAGAHLCTPSERELLERLVVTPDGAFNTGIVGQAPARLADMAGFSVSGETTILIAEQDGVGPSHPLSREKLAPLLAWYEADDWRSGCHRCIELIEYGGEGHTMGIHCRDPEVILAFGIEKPVARLIVNGPTTQGAVGYSTGLAPSMTLGCGAMGGNITSDNIGPHHLINVKRIAYPRPQYFAAQGQSADESNLAPERARESKVASGGRAVPAPAAASAGAAGAAMIRRALAGARVPPQRDSYTRTPEE